MSDTLANFFNWPFSHPTAIAWYWDLVRILLRVLISVFFVLLMVPGLVWAERRLLGFMQQRQGPNRVGPWGLLQPIADAFKLIMKEDIIPSSADRLLYVMAPIVMLIPALVTCAVIPWNASKIWGAAAPNANIGILYVLAVSSLGVYGIVLAGWSSNNKYALLGGLRSSAQMISYELGMGLAVITAVLMAGSVGTQSIVANQSGYWSTPMLAHYGIGFPQWHIFQFFPMGLTATLIYVLAAVAETNRAPFDLPEAETELVAGYHTEYTSMKFAMFFMGEYANMVVVSAVAATLWFGGFTAPIPWLGEVPAYLKWVFHGWNADWLTFALDATIPAIWLIAKIFVGLYVFIWIRATLPRLRYDMLMAFGWKGLLPLAVANILCVSIAMAADSYLVGAVAWVVCAAIVLVVVASLKSTKRFTTKTRRSATVQLFSTAQPYGAGAAGGSSRPVSDSAETASGTAGAQEKV